MQDGRFSAMAKGEFGGTTVLKWYLETGRIISRKNTSPASNAAKPLPAKRRRLENLGARQRKRDRYYENMVEKMGRGEVVPNQSPRVQYHVDKRTRG